MIWSHCLYSQSDSFISYHCYMTSFQFGMNLANLDQNGGKVHVGMGPLMSCIVHIKNEMFGSYFHF